MRITKNQLLELKTGEEQEMHVNNLLLGITEEHL